MPIWVKGAMLLVGVALLGGCTATSLLNENAPSAKIIQPGPADTVLHNGAVYTVNNAQPWAEAVAIRDGVIVFVGDDDEIDPFIDDNTQIINLDGRMLMPGFHDSHQHPLEAGSEVGGTCALTPNTDPETFIPLLRQCAPNQIGTDWVLGFGHSIHTLLETDRPPVEILDEAIPDQPAAMLEETSHSLWVNSRALALAGITADTPNPIGGVIGKDPVTGELTGILFENAGNMVLDLAFARSAELDELHYQGVLFSLEHLAQNGITSIADARTYWERGYHEAWERAERENTLTVRAVLGLWAYPHFDDDDQLRQLMSMYQNDPNRLLRFSQVKLYSDGIIGNGTAALVDAYNQDLGVTGDRGLNYFDEARLTRYIIALERAGFDVHIHTIGDRAVRESLNAIEDAQQTNGATVDRRHRLTHLELIHPDDRPRFEQLGVIADFQVAGEFTDPGEAALLEPLIGERAFQQVPVRAIYDTGATITLSSDWDVSDVNPLVGIQRSLNRGQHSLPDLHAAIRAYTLNAAYLMRQETLTGSIEVGKLADVIVLDRNLFDLPTNSIDSATILLTMLEGEVVYQHQSFRLNN